MQYNRATSSATGRVANETVPTAAGRCAPLRDRAQCASLIAPYGAGYGPGALRGDAPSGSTSLILSPPQTAARVETFMIAVLPQVGQRHRNANGEAAEGAQSQDVSGCIIGAILLVSWFASPLGCALRSIRLRP